ncbi:FkbM family methyltransferase [Frigidibacter sp. SD6-1]|uniref:FkbM family methyltransferase n=1 Tax=Frigidibacter sp. SD6-1 TaxID=3032581 RepID=UPI0024DF70A1|nr:FkbM family methyltransferase [Frigidibacter sp. SD6-1]
MSQFDPSRSDPNPDLFPTWSLSLLERLQDAPGFIGRSAARKYRRRMFPFSLREMDRRLAALTPDDICLDLGANVGAFTEIMARSGARVHAFEPDPETFERLGERVGHLPNVTLHQKAVGERNGRLQLYRAADFASDFDNASQASSLHYQGGRMRPVDGCLVEVMGFAELLHAFGRPVAVIKMDVEGAEWEVLEALLAGRLPLDFGALFVETHERLERRRYPQVVAMRRAARKMAAPYINLYWP